MPLVAVLLGVSMVSLAVFDYVTSPADQRGIHLGDLFIPIGPQAPAVVASRPPSTGRPSPRPPQPTPKASGLKSVIHGYIDRRSPPPGPWNGTVTAFVVNVNWSDLQSAPGAPIATNNAIDKAIATSRSLAARGIHLAIKIRFYAGINAPQWAKNLGGSPVTIYDPTAARGGTVGRFWTPQFGAAYDAVWRQLAARYDTVPEIHQIEVDRCGTVFTESLVRDTANAQSVTNLLAAGFSVAADRLCVQDELAQGRAWRFTRIGFELNPYKAINANGSVTNDEAFTDQMMNYCRQMLGRQCVLENDSIRWPPITGDMGRLYTHMRALGAPTTFQTAIPSRVGNLLTTVSWAAQQGAAAVELPSSYPTYSPSLFSTNFALLSANPG